MRRSLITSSTFSNVFAKPSLISTFSSSAGSGGAGGGGRGRGRGSDPPTFQFTPRAPGKTPDTESDTIRDDSTFDSPLPSGRGHGRGKPLPSTPVLPSFPSFMPGAVDGVGATAGRGRIAAVPSQFSDSRPQEVPEQVGPRKPIFFSKKDEDDPMPIVPVDNKGESDLRQSIMPVLKGSGRGKPTSQPVVEEKARQESRYLRARPPGGGTGRPRDVGEGSGEVLPRLNSEEAAKKAMEILSRGGGGERLEEGGEGGGRGFGRSRGRGFGRGRGRGGQEGRGRGGVRYRRREDSEDSGSGLFLGNNADGEKLAKKLGTEVMNQLVEGFEECSGRVLPSPLDDAYLDAMHTNYMIECEPEYMMGDFESNPDIDEKPPIPLRDALEKMKPFLMAYEGIKSQEEWEEVMEETMEKVPIIKELVDYYSGPDRVTAKQQQEELERVAKTLPESAPASVKRYTDRAVLSLQSNPGWGFDKKCQFMDKLVWEVSQQYK